MIGDQLTSFEAVPFTFTQFGSYLESRFLLILRTQLSAHSILHYLYYQVGITSMYKSKKYSA